MAAMAGLILGLVPRLDGGVVALQGIGRGGVETISFFPSEVVVIVSAAAAVLLVKVMVTVVDVLLGFGATILGSNKARRCATETLQPNKLLSDILDTNGSLFGSDFLTVGTFALV